MSVGRRLAALALLLLAPLLAYADAGPKLYLQPNTKAPDGTAAFVHLTPQDMPMRVAIGYPKEPAKHAGRKQTRETAIEAMRAWETALQPHLPWFAIQFSEKDPNAPFQVEWKRRITGPWAGFGGIGYELGPGGISVNGRLEISTRMDQYTSMTLDQLRHLVAHEFGHVLGLMHCLDCDSAMNYSWNTRDRVEVTESDVRTYLALVALPNGSRADGSSIVPTTRKVEWKWKSPPPDSAKGRALPDVSGGSVMPVPRPEAKAKPQVDPEAKAKPQVDPEEPLYEEGPMGWREIERDRRLRGPLPGERWLTRDEMKRIKRERAEAQAFE